MSVLRCCLWLQGTSEEQHGQEAVSSASGAASAPPPPPNAGTALTREGPSQRSGSAAAARTQRYRVAQAIQQNPADPERKSRSKLPSMRINDLS